MRAARHIVHAPAREIEDLQAHACDAREREGEDGMPLTPSAGCIDMRCTSNPIFELFMQACKFPDATSV
jgi:hypothetical protein